MKSTSIAKSLTSLLGKSDLPYATNISRTVSNLLNSKLAKMLSPHPAVYLYYAYSGGEISSVIVDINIGGKPDNPFAQVMRQNFTLEANRIAKRSGIDNFFITISSTERCVVDQVVHYDHVLTYVVDAQIKELLDLKVNPNSEDLTFTLSSLPGDINKTLAIAAHYGKDVRFRNIGYKDVSAWVPARVIVNAYTRKGKLHLPREYSKYILMEIAA